MPNVPQSQQAPRPQAWLAWSSGKDSAWALHTVRQAAEFDVVALLTTVNSTHQRVAMHAVRESLLEIQAAAAGLPLIKVPIPSPCSNEIYEQAMSHAMDRARAEGVQHVIFGDLFLEDVRAYREKQLATCGMIPVFPLWGRNTRQLADEMLASRPLRFSHLRRSPPARPLLRRTPLRRRSPGRPPAPSRSLRRKRRVPHLRLRRPHVPRHHPSDARRNRRP